MAATTETTNTPLDELEDYAGTVLPALPEIGRDKLTSPATLRGLAAFAAGAIVIVWPERTTRVFGVIVGMVLVVVSAVELVRAYRRWSQRSLTGWEIVRHAGTIVIGVVILAWPSITLRVLAQLVGIILVGSGLTEIFRATRRHRFGSSANWPIARGAVNVAIGAVAFLVPGQLVGVVIAVIGLWWVLAGVLTMVTNLRTDGEDEIDVRDTWTVFLGWLEGRHYSVDDRRRLYEKLFFEGHGSVRRLARFFILMVFATVIATYGIITDSIAVVIGAMLIAPLMTPLMGTAASLVMGWPKRALRSGLTALVGVVLAVVLSFLLIIALPFDVGIESNTQILSRVSPTLIDLTIALVAGAAGAFAMSRPDVSDALPGVAVAIALVPPLTVAGVALEAGSASDSLGALVLFTTNVVAILLAGAVTFVLTGFTPLRRMTMSPRRLRTTFATITVLGLMVFGALAAGSDDLNTEVFRLDDTQSEVEDWLGDDTSLRVVNLDVDGDDVAIEVVGPDRPPDPTQLAESLSDVLGDDITVTVRWAPEEVFKATARG